MNVAVEWFNDEKTILMLKFQQKWLWNDLFVAIDQATHMMDTVSHKLYLFLDMRDSPSVPNLNPIGLQRIANAPTTTHENLECFIMIGAKLHIKTMFDVFSRIYPKAAKQYRLVNTLEEALSLTTPTSSEQ